MGIVETRFKDQRKPSEVDKIKQLGCVSIDGVRRWIDIKRSTYMTVQIGKMMANCCSYVLKLWTAIPMRYIS